MNVLSRKLHEINKTSVIPEPAEAPLFIEDQRELQLHRTALQILENRKNEIEDFQNDLDCPSGPTLSESDQAILDESNRFLLKRFFLLFQNFGNAYVYYGNKMAEWIFWVRLLWLIGETQEFAVQQTEEQQVLDSPGFFKLCTGEQDEKLKPIYDKWNHNLFTEESFKQ